jgi:ankyrin repeat protein
MHVLDAIQVCPQTQATLNEALDHLLKAAIGNIANSRSIVGWLYNAFGKQLPVHIQSQELEWLSTSMIAGSDTARRRLKALNPPDETYNKAIYSLRLQRYEFHLDSVIKELEDRPYATSKPGQLPSLRDYKPSDDQSALLFIVMTGNDKALTTLLSHKPSLDLNIKDARNVTPLMMACIAGHAKVAEQLLRHGADPTIAAVTGTTPLHFLSSFDDEHIPALADALVKASASLEARATTAEFGPGAIANSYLRIAKGTPLTFAVQQTAWLLFSR